MSEGKEVKAAEAFEVFGLDAKRSALLGKKVTAKTRAFSGVVADAKAAGVDVVESGVANLLYDLAMACPREEFLATARAYTVRRILRGDLKNKAQVDAAVKFVDGLKVQFKGGDETIVDADFDAACGVGIELSEADVRARADAFVAENKNIVDEFRYNSFGRLRGKLANDPELRFVDGLLVKKGLDDALAAYLGPKTEEDLNPQKKKKKKKKAAAAAAATAAAAAAAAAATKDDKGSAEEGEEEENDDFVTARGDIAAAVNTAEQLKRCEEATGGTVLTRFPPEPNGFLHIGHAKAINFNFGVAAKNKGECILRFDDTNPDAEEKEYIDKIIECVRWLGHEPARITYSSEYFDELYALAIKLIKIGKAYVCHQTKAEIEASRKVVPREPSPFRDRSVEENLRLFEDMRKGKFGEGEATLRMKQDLSHPNPNMWDLVAYRIKYTPHPHIGDKWCIYPSYDYTHCLVDSLEFITYSLCTLEFEVRRESYYWLLDVLDLYKPKVWEYSRLGLEYAVMSKRKLRALVEEGLVDGWDDPRLVTLMGLRRRGYNAAAINDFCARVGVSRKDSNARAPLLEYCARLNLDPEARRAFVVQEPLKVTLTNWPADKVEEIRAPLFPQKPENKEERVMPLSSTVYIERSDFRMQDDPKYYGLAPGKKAYLRYAYVICVDEVVSDPKTGAPAELRCSVDFQSMAKRDKKIKGLIHWVSPRPGQKEPHTAVVRTYDYLFKTPNPGGADDWREQINKDSKHVFERAFVEESVAKGTQPEDKFQFERLGYYCADFESKPDRLVFNCTISLKQGKDRPTAKKAKK